MILLDTNYLIQLLVRGTAEALQIKAWLQAGEVLCTASVSWYEFSVGPVTPQAVSVVRAVLRGGVLPLTETGAEKSAQLWNQTGRLRSLRVDCLVAGTALDADIAVASSNLRDFHRFTPAGLKVV